MARIILIAVSKTKKLAYASFFVCVSTTASVRRGTGALGRTAPPFAPSKAVKKREKGRLKDRKKRPIND
ncbi:hypothetical protein [Pandoraea sp. NPDC087047]|uniref:hypothetical protein n=1 Tax=Pandoraea sp. NPDC087047 TaxID=3364390 RepID=UPI0038085E27